MATSAQMRAWYPELVVEPLIPLCNYEDTARVKFLAGGSSYPQGYVWLRCHPAVEEWMQALAAVMYHHGYDFREPAGGTLSCRKITGGSRTSLHAHGVALDINPSKNRYRGQWLGGLIQWGKDTDMPPEMIDDLKNIRTVEGYRITEWGGDWINIKDPMHFQCSKCTRAQLEQGIDLTQVPGWYDYALWAGLMKEEDMAFLPLKHGDGLEGREFKRSDVAHLQSKLNDVFSEGLVEDGRYGDLTAGVVTMIPGAEPGGRIVTGKMFTTLDKLAAVKAAEPVLAAITQDLMDHLNNHPSGGITLEEALDHTHGTGTGVG